MRWLLDRPWIALGLAIALYVTLFLALQCDLRAADPLWYAEKAHDLAHGAEKLRATRETYPFAMRLGLTTPIALMYRMFGVSTLATNVPCLLAGLAIIAIAYAAAPTPRARLLAMAFVSVCTPLVADAHEINPDLPCAAAMAASVLCLSRRDRPRGAAWTIGAVVAWFVAFQIKEAAAWCAPVWLYAVVCDLRDRGARWVVRVFAPAVAAGAVLAAGYLALCAAVWGDPMARFHGIQAAASTHEWSMAGQPTRQWLARLIWEPPVLLFKMFRTALVLVVVSPWLVRGRDRIWIVATLAIIALYWFGSSTTAAYIPLPLVRRMILPALPGIVVLSALAGDAALDRRKPSAGGGPPDRSGGGAGVLPRGPSASAGVRDPRWRTALGLVLAVSLVFPHVTSLRKLVLPGHAERAVYAVLRSEVAGTTGRVVVVCGDPRCPPITGFHFGFEPPANLTVVTAAEFAAAPLPSPATVRAIVHTERSNGAGRDLGRRAEALGLRPLVWDREIRLYDAGDGARLHDALTTR
jgi:hypothetical protein